MPTDKKRNDLLTQPIKSTLTKMTIPMMMGMVALMSFNLVDTFFIGLIGTDELAAVSFTFPITFTLISLTIGLGVGTSAVIAKTLGSGQEDKAQIQGCSALILSTVLVIGLAVLGYLTIDPLFILLGSEANTLNHIHDYMQIWYLGAVFLTLPMIGNAILRASGDTKTPGIIMALGGFINAVLDPILIFGWGPVPAMGIQGAAFASVAAWIVSSSLIIYLLTVQRGLVELAIPAFDKLKLSVIAILKIGLPASGASMLTPLAMSILTAIIAQYGHEAVAAFGVGQRIESIASMLVLALSMTLPPFISQNLGANQTKRVQQAYKMSCRFVLFWQLGVYVLLAVCAPWIADAFSDNEKVQHLICIFIWILPVGYGLQGIVILTNSSFNALHQPMISVQLSILRLFVFYVPFAYIGGLVGGIVGLFAACVIANLLMASVSFMRFNHYFKQIQITSKA
ncbi:MATE family efflux transporter [Catenovulum adriaticum]|uniref:MATE family efflux transporter n=1 Tax=Catenovulum adriaticum TaxID=2984846 RepID=A0ABY7AMF9_9ALTE|nr:MATE family efflux transporter [Catenovulum sp. TS8]WAJ69491.1 MATE family efflux transporter [Catenovulum sp. TS8]